MKEMRTPPESKWIRFEAVPVPRTRKTPVWVVVTKGDQPKGDDADPAAGLHELGQVRWYGPWRCYAFFPAPGTLFEQRCLRDIATFLRFQMAARKRLRASR